MAHSSSGWGNAHNSSLLLPRIRLWVRVYVAFLEKPHLPWSFAKVAQWRTTAVRGQSKNPLFRSCVWSWENKESVYVLCAPHFRVCVCVMTYSEHCEVFQPTLRRLWLDRRGSVWPAKTHSGHTNSELCMVWEERERWKVRYERNRSRVEERGRQDEREGGGWRELIMFTKCAPTHTHTHTPQLSNDRVTDVVLVSIGRYPVLKNPFRLVKPLTHKS